MSSFEDLSDPVNFSKAFSADEDKNFRGLPHERMFASIMAGVFLMAENNCAQALPYFRNAEFLDARFQKMPFGTDAPLPYALMYRCVMQSSKDSAELSRAETGIHNSVRFLTWQEPLLEALVSLAKVDIRPMAISNRLAYMIYETSLYHSLINAPSKASLDDLLEDAAKNASLFTSIIDSAFEDEYKRIVRPAIIGLSQLQNLDKKDGLKYLEDLAFHRVELDVKTIANNLKKTVSSIDNFAKKMEQAQKDSQLLTEKIMKAVKAEKLVLNFSGFAPTLAREGAYDEIAVIKPGLNASTKAQIRLQKIKTPTACGFHRQENGGFSVVHCLDNAVSNQAGIEVLDSVEMLSMSRKATSTQGRKFDKILKGRAQFRAATEDIAKVSAWSAFFLFYMGSDIISRCQKRGAPQSCYAPGYALMAIAGVTVVFSGTVWLIGRSSNPAADSRFIHLMFESTWMAI